MFSQYQDSSTSKLIHHCYPATVLNITDGTISKHYPGVIYWSYQGIFTLDSSFHHQMQRPFRYDQPTQA